MGSCLYFNRYRFWALISSLEVPVLGMRSSNYKQALPYLYYSLGDKKTNGDFRLR